MFKSLCNTRTYLLRGQSFRYFQLQSTSSKAGIHLYVVYQKTPMPSDKSISYDRNFDSEKNLSLILKPNPIIKFLAQLKIVKKSKLNASRNGLW